MMLLVLANYAGNLQKYYGYDWANMVNPMKLILLSVYSNLGYGFANVYPFLVIIPAAFAFFADRSSRELLYIQGRTTRKDYYFGTMLAVFAVTFAVFVIPMLIEIALNCVAFPIDTMGDPSNVELLQAVHISGVEMYLFSGLWKFNPIVYAVFMIGLVGCVSGALACLTASLSMFRVFKFRILMFIPIYVLLSILSMIREAPRLGFSTSYYDYIRVYEIGELSEGAYLLFIIGLIVFVWGLLCIRIKKDELL